jgi:hypothetical protein
MVSPAWGGVKKIDDTKPWFGKVVPRYRGVKSHVILQLGEIIPEKSFSDPRVFSGE